MLAVADPEEVWVFEIMPVGPLWSPKTGQPGAIWCAQRVPDDEVSICPNESRIGEIDLNKPDFFMASANVISYAVDNGLWDPKSGQPFSWKKLILRLKAVLLLTGDGPECGAFLIWFRLLPTLVRHFRIWISPFRSSLTVNFLLRMS